MVICAGQEPLRTLADELLALGLKAHCIGGAFEAGELDAQRAIDQGARLAAGGIGVGCKTLSAYAFALRNPKTGSEPDFAMVFWRFG